MWTVLLLWVMQQVSHVCLLMGSRIDYSEQESAVAHSMESYAVFHLFLCLLAGAGMEFAVGDRSASSVAFHLWLVVETPGVPLPFLQFLLEQEAAMCCYLE